MKRIIALVLCLMAVVSACMAEEMPAGVYTGRIKMYGKIPEKTMETVFSGYMVPDSEKVFADNSAWSCWVHRIEQLHRDSCKLSRLNASRVENLGTKICQFGCLFKMELGNR